MTKKIYTIRYYIPRVGADGRQGTVAEILSNAINPTTRMGTVREAGSKVHQIRHSTNLGGGKVWCGYFVRFRDELPRVGNRTSDEEKPPVLAPGEEVIEKNHFVLFTEASGVEVIAYQMSMEGSDVTALARYLTHANGNTQTVSLDEVLSRDTLELLKNGVLKNVEFEVAKPRSRSYAPNPDDTWTAEAMKFMSETGASRYRVKILTKSRKNGLLSGIKDQIRLMMDSTQTKHLSVKLSDVDHPIDLFADRIFDKVSVDFVKGWPDSEQMFHEIVAVKGQNKGIEIYLANSDEALE